MNKYRLSALLIDAKFISLKGGIALFVLLIIGFSCKKNTFKAVDPVTEYSYFGLGKGRFIEYKVEYIEHDSLLNKHDTTNFFYKTVIGEEYYDNQDRLGYEYLRYRKDSLNGEYTFLSKWLIQIVDNRAQLVEENQRKTKLIFPITDSQKWDINAFNNEDELEAHYEDIHTTYQNDDFQTDSSVTVEIYKYETLIDKYLEQEIYAKGVGMISKISRELYFQFGQTKPYKGTDLKMEIFKTGKE